MSKFRHGGHRAGGNTVISGSPPPGSRDQPRDQGSWDQSYRDQGSKEPGDRGHVHDQSRAAAGGGAVNRPGKRSDRDRRRDKDHRRDNKGSSVLQKKKPLPLSPARREFLEVIHARLQQNSLDRHAALEALRKSPPICPKCQDPIDDLAAALTDTASGLPVHFDCVLKILKDRESCAPHETIAYIGNGKFAILSTGAETAEAEKGTAKKFSIRKTVEWEKTEGNNSWRDEIASLYSQVV